MKRLLHTAVLLTAFSVGTLFPQKGSAEKCWMVGCVGMIGYVYIPATQVWPFLIDTPFCSEASKFFPFQTKGLPDVNSTVTINGALLLSEGYIEKHPDDFPLVYIDVTHMPCHAELQPSDLQGMEMKGGAKVRILGYRSFVNSANLYADLMFALVQIVTDD